MNIKHFIILLLALLLCVSAVTAVYDVEEVHEHINRVWTYVNSSTDTWWATVRFGSHGSDPQDAENPDVDILCFRQEIVEWQGATRTLNDPW